MRSGLLPILLCPDCGARLDPPAMEDQHKHSYKDVEAWFRGAGLEDVRRLSFPVSVSGRRPGAGEVRR